MSITAKPLTYDDLLQMPDDGRRREIIGGELIVNPAPRRDHHEVAANLDWLLQRFLRTTGLGRVYTHPVDVWLGRNDMVQPDLVVIRESRLDIYQPEGIVTSPPDVVIEIVSPSSRGIDRVRKMALYARAGVPEYWLIDPQQRTVEIGLLAAGEYASVPPDAEGCFASREFPGLRFDPREVFARLDG